MENSIDRYPWSLPTRRRAELEHDEQSISCEGGGMMRAGLCQAITVFWHSLAQRIARALDRKGFLLVDG